MDKINLETTPKSLLEFYKKNPGGAFWAGGGGVTQGILVEETNSPSQTDISHTVKVRKDL